MGESVDLLWKIGASYVWSALANFCGRHKKFCFSHNLGAFLRTTE